MNEKKSILGKLNKYVKFDLTVRQKNLFFKVFTKRNVSVSFFNTIQVDRGFPSDTTIIHEFAHYLDRCKYNKKTDKFETNFFKQAWWYLRYSFPISLVFIMLPFTVYFWCNFWLLLLIIPMPLLTKFRFNAEIKGYYWNYIRGQSVKSIRASLTSKTYLYMKFFLSPEKLIQLFNEYESKHTKALQIIEKALNEKINN